MRTQTCDDSRRVRRQVGWVSGVCSGVAFLMPAMFAAHVLVGLVTRTNPTFAGPSASALNSDIRVRAASVAPGQMFAVTAGSFGGIGSWIDEVRLRDSDGSGDVVWHQGKQDASTANFVISLPSDTKLGSRRLHFDLDIHVKYETGRAGNTVYYDSSALTEGIDIDLPVASSSDVARRDWFWRAIALLAWLLVAFPSYALGRWFSGPRPGTTPDPWRGGYELRALGLIGVLVIGIVADFTFFGPIMRTTTWPVGIGTWSAIALVWIIPMIVGGVSGMRAHSDDFRWSRGTLRSVVGSVREAGYRDASTRLPAMLDRESPLVETAAIIESMRAVGCDVSVRGRNIHVSLDGEAVMRLHAKRDGGCLPQDLEVWILDDLDATALIRELARLYGPLEFTPPKGKRVIVDG